jgi:hypothetical protein
MLQQIIAFIIISFFVARLIIQKNQRQITGLTFIIWLIFWIIAAILIFFIKYLDRLAILLGFSASGIQILIYLSLIIVFYLLLKVRLKIEKMEKDITILTRQNAILAAAPDSTSKNKEKNYES